MQIHKMIRALWLLAAGVVLGVAAHAQQFPSRPIKILVGFAAGSATDAIARLYGQKLSELLNTPVIIDNKAGASQLLAIRTLMSAPADGYTLLIAGGSGLSQGPGVRKDLPYDPMKDFTLAAFLATSPGLITVNASLPVHSLAELISYAKANPDRLSFASAGLGSAGHLEGEYFMNLTGTKMVHIPYKSDSEAMREVAAGTVQVGMTTAQFAIPLVGSGKVRALAVDGFARMDSLPGVPTAGESS